MAATPGPGFAWGHEEEEEEVLEEQEELLSSDDDGSDSDSFIFSSDDSDVDSDATVPGTGGIPILSSSSESDDEDLLQPLNPFIVPPTSP